MLKIGVTGGIGSGKTTICKIFEVLGVPVYYADTEAKALMESDNSLVENIKEIFGDEIYSEGKLNRKKLSDIVFENSEKLAQLNALVHPAVISHSQNWFLSQKMPYVIKEAALLFESGSYEDLDKIIMVYAPREIRITRVTERDNVTPSAVEARMHNQMPEEEKRKKSDFVIMNGEQELVLPQVLKIHRQLLNLAEKKLKD